MKEKLNLKDYKINMAKYLALKNSKTGDNAADMQLEARSLFETILSTIDDGRELTIGTRVAWNTFFELGIVEEIKNNNQ